MTNHIRPKKQKICAEEMAQAFEMREAGEKLIVIAMTLNVSENYISKCFKLAAEKGFDRFPPRDRPKRGPGIIPMQCHCGKKYETRRADIARRQGKDCSRECSHLRREFGLHPGRLITAGPFERFN